MFKHWFCKVGWKIKNNSNNKKKIAGHIHVKYCTPPQYFQRAAFYYTKTLDGWGGCHQNKSVFGDDWVSCCSPEETDCVFPYSGPVRFISFPDSLWLGLTVQLWRFGSSQSSFAVEQHLLPSSKCCRPQREVIHMKSMVCASNVKSN